MHFSQLAKSKTTYCVTKRFLPIEAFERNRPSVWRSECQECRASKKPIPAKVRREYEERNPRPEIGSEFYCIVCDSTIIVEKNRDVNLDHNHETGEIRGWICNRCNTGIGNLRENPSILERAIRWLKGTLLSIFLN
ncbi:hypothetical protein F4X10_04255 [Candidatus Poribacteria bacterium]|nr:hypothetical protein [Candidatus Poribacteria bacterium]